ncbi:MAG: hypothetical protein OEQ13_00680 [Acidobacteriota bacterium]|nr:hypothetical protein [Acidobacteriota bacterium]
MLKKTVKHWQPAALALLFAFGVVACNDVTDDPKISDNLVSLSGFAPLSACVDIDGELIDTTGDGTLDTSVFTSVVQSAGFDSRIRGTSSSGFNDVIFTSVDISYELTGAPMGVPAPRTETITVTVPAGGSASVPVTSVLAGDVVAGFFDLATRGNVLMTFRGADVTGEPASATGRSPLETANICN